VLVYDDLIHEISDEEEEGLQEVIPKSSEPQGGYVVITISSLKHLQDCGFLLFVVIRFYIIFVQLLICASDSVVEPQFVALSMCIVDHTSD